MFNELPTVEFSDKDKAEFHHLVEHFERSAVQDPYTLDFAFEKCDPFIACHMSSP